MALSDSFSAPCQIMYLLKLHPSETPSASYIVKEGETVKGSSWLVEKIEQTTVTLSKADSKKIITMAQ